MIGCKYERLLSDAGFCKTAGYYCTATQEANCKIKHDEIKTMPNEMNHAEVAEQLEHILKYPVPYGRDAIIQAAADERRIANGELVEVVHGHWVDDHQGNTACSICGNVTELKEHLTGNMPKYCPSCGALMGGKDDNHETD